MDFQRLTASPEVLELYQEQFPAHPRAFEEWEKAAGTFLAHPSQRRRLDTLMEWPEAVGLFRETVGHSLVRFRTLWSSIFESLGKVLRPELLRPAPVSVNIEVTKFERSLTFL